MKGNNGLRNALDNRVLHKLTEIVEKLLMYAIFIHVSFQDGVQQQLASRFRE